MSKVVITSDGLSGKVSINGNDISGCVREIRYTHRASDVPILTLEIVCIDGVAIEANDTILKLERENFISGELPR